MNSKRDYVKIFATIAGLINIVAIIIIVIPIIHLTPLTLIISAVFGGGLMVLAILIYVGVVTRDLIKRGIL